MNPNFRDRLSEIGKQQARSSITQPDRQRTPAKKRESPGARDLTSDDAVYIGRRADPITLQHELEVQPQAADIPVRATQTEIAMVRGPLFC